MADIMRNLPALRLVAVAAAAGIVAGVTSLYVMGGPDGNTGETAQAGACAAKAEKVAALEPAISGEVAAMLPADPPQSMSDLAFNGPDGEAMTVADLSGKTLLVNLWATWCTPCREEMPALDALQRENGSDKFEVVAVNIDRGSDEKPKAFLEETGVDSLAYYRDNSMDVFNTLKTRGLALGLPVTLLVDEDGCLLAHMNGPADWASADAVTLVQAAMGEGGG
ncbi:thiol:disulfide interchange protein TlpA [Chelativorans sp. M5D2P16]|uniref:thiol:disulfide interchange protein TlpA n=1 Tax=Chelativorans sp. M5D2P16 TaxID=3095678 RepID=UPI002ACAF2A9|nr:TlpA disulfide reductase family protein [Chelativorans sp. M5D2P16]MDZ5699920.1 TlpA disulfide reductase family protein [Chelativorans sp. M5D2P16]